MGLHFFVTVGNGTKEAIDNVLAEVTCDDIILLTTTDNQINAEEIRKRILKKDSDIEVRVKNIDSKFVLKSLYEILEEVYNILQEDSYASFAVDISGASKVLTMAVSLAATISNAELFFYERDKTHNEYTKIPIIRLIDLVTLSWPKVIILNVLNDLGSVNSLKHLKDQVLAYKIKTLNDRIVGKSISRFSSHLRMLRELGLVYYDERKRPLNISITEEGRYYLKVWGLRKRIGELLK